MTVSITAAYNPDLSRIQLTASDTAGTAAYYSIDRDEESSAFLVAQPVRAATLIPYTPSAVLHVDDYEFADGIPNSYRFRTYTSAKALLSAATTTITPSIGVAWLTSPLSPFLNMKLNAVDYDAPVFPSRGQAFNVLGRRAPVAVTEVQGGRQMSVTVFASGIAQRRAYETFFSFGTVIYLQTPINGALPDSGWFMVGDVEEQREGSHLEQGKFLKVPLTEVARPDPSVAGYTANYQAVDSSFATYAILDAAFATYGDLSRYVASPTHAIVG